jgi:hypothetical protein
MSTPETQTTNRPNIAEQSQIDTIGESSMSVSPDLLPWIDKEADISTRIVDTPYGQFQFGNVIGASGKLKKIAETDMRGREHDEDKLNRLMYDSISQILSGNPGAIKRFKNSPEGIDIFYDGLYGGARVYFADLGKDDKGMRTFLKAAVCGSKSTEPKVLSTFSGRGEKAV